MTVHEKIIRALERVPTMEKAIEYLRTYNFRFFEGSLLFAPEMEIECKYSWMLRKTGKKWDKTLMVGIKLWGKRTRKIIIILHGSQKMGSVRVVQKYKVIKKDWKETHDINFKRSVVTVVFPNYLDYDERRKWRTEHQKQMKNPEREPSKWYSKILSDVKFLEKHEQRVAHG